MLGSPYGFIELAVGEFLERRLAAIRVPFLFLD